MSIKAAEPVTRGARGRHLATEKNVRIAKIVAVVCGLLGTVLALAAPFMPVKQTVAQLEWPGPTGQIRNVTAPAVSFVPVDMKLSVPCSAASKLPADGGVILSTIPENGVDASRNGLFIRATKDAVIVTERDVVLLSTPRADAQRNTNCAINITADPQGTKGTIDGAPETSLTRFGIGDGNMRPQIVGVFSDLPDGAAKEAGLEKLSFHATIDTRFTSTPTSLKFWALVVGIVMAVAALLSLLILDAQDGRGFRRFLPRNWWRIRPVDVSVVGVLLFWWIAGGNTADDGYQVTVGRMVSQAGYPVNYYRYFGVGQDPFGWHYQFISLWEQFSTSTPWLRVPTLLLALLGWWVLSREVFPRLGRSVRDYQPALWGGALLYLAVWLPYNNGLRVEPAIAVGALLTWVSVERCIATGRMLPLSVAIITAAFTLDIHPEGMIAVAALLAGARPVMRRIVAVRRRDGILPLLGPIFSAGFSVLFLIFADQTLATVIQTSTVNGQVGPTNKWWEEPMRYYMLMNPTADGSVGRRFGILLLLMVVLFVTFVLLRRRHPMGFAKGPLWRLIGVVALTLFFLTFVPTKWTHQLGIFAAIAGALGAAATAMAGPVIMRSRRNRTFFLAGTLYVLAVAFSAHNEWWYVGSYGISWRNATPQLGGIDFATMILAAAVVVTLIGLWQHYRTGYVDDAVQRGVPSDDAAWWRKLRAPAIVLTCAIMLLFIGATFTKAIYTQRDSWSWASSNARALTGNPCALADNVLVERNPGADQLVPARAAGQNNPSPGDALAGKEMTGFTPNGVKPGLTADDSVTRSQQQATNEGDASAQESSGGESSTSSTSDAGSGGSAEVTNEGKDTSATAETTGTTSKALGVNGSQVKLPFGLDPSKTPVLGTYGGATGSLTSDWYTMPALTADNPLITMAVAGSVEYTDDVKVHHDGQKVKLQLGHLNPDGSVRPLGIMEPLNVIDGPTWRDLRFPRAAMASGANVVRIVAQDQSTTKDEWVAVTPPRAPKLETLQNVVGSTAPVMIDWEVGLTFPCQRPAASRNGMLEVPQWRVLPDADGAWINSVRWMDGNYGGPLGLVQSLTRATIVPSYLKNDWAKDWGSVQRLQLLKPAVPADVQIGDKTVFGTYNPGPMRAVDY